MIYTQYFFSIGLITVYFTVLFIIVLSMWIKHFSKFRKVIRSIERKIQKIFIRVNKEKIFIVLLLNFISPIYLKVSLKEIIIFTA